MHAVKKRSSATLNVYLIVRKGDRVLLSLRQNTGYNDGLYGFLAGHVEEDESATAAIIREAEEEAGIKIAANDVKVVHLMHRKTDRNNVDIFCECSNWQGEISNREPEKCGELSLFPLDALPDNIMPYIAKAIHALQREELYSEDGW